MAIANKERVGRGLEQLRAGLTPYIERELKQKLGNDWIDEVGKRTSVKSVKGELHWDSQGLLKTMNEFWHDVFARQLDKYERNLVHELIEIRNRYAHDHTFTSDDTDRALDSTQRLLQSVGATEQAHEVGRSKEELRRTVYAEQARNKTRYQVSVEGTPSANIKPWREIVTPHPDVQSGRYVQAEFAADLAQVARNEGTSEYTDPVEFFQRTYITSGLGDLLAGALQRLGGEGGDPVVELQTNFGGGKTHSMLALYHLFGGTPSSALPGMEPVLAEAGIKKAPTAKRAVLVGTDLSPGQTHKRGNTKIRTMWGELAWQLGGKDGFKLVADSDAKSTSPGSDVLAELFRKYSPALILIDEWVAYARQCVGKDDLPAGNFDTQASFAQAITEAAKRAPRALVVASIPASKIEVGGEHGQHALDTLKDVFERVAKAWRPASSDEGFEIVRRRLFEPVSDPELAKLRDAAIRQCMLLYKKHAQEFPPGVAEGAYERKMLAAYPIHPELFERLYEDWSTLDKFQRTRGVLRLLARVINRLWEGQDKSVLIMPSSIPVDDGAVRSELTRYLPDVWEPIIGQDVDGPESMPAELDRTMPTLGRVSAARRVARAIYVGTAPGSDGKNPGIDDRSVRLACVQPGESVATFGDALRRVSDRAKYIHQDQSRYWISTKPNLNRLAEDRAASLQGDPETLWNEIRSRLAAQHKDPKSRGDFVAGVHVCPETPQDVDDEPTARLVILRPSVTHKRKDTDSPALTEARAYLESRGAGPRINQNCLIFLAADRAELEKLRDATAAYLAWSGIWDEREALNLDPFHQKQAQTKKAEFDSTIDVRIGGTWQWALIPHQSEPGAAFTFDERKISGQGPLGERTSTKLSGEALIPAMGGPNLRMELDRHLWQGKNHVSFANLAEWFPRYLYLPRVVNRDVIARAIAEGASRTDIRDTFATAAGWDEANSRYRGLKLIGAPTIELTTLVVRPEVAHEQSDAEKRAQDAGRPRPDSQSPPLGDPDIGSTHGGPSGSAGAPGADATPRPFTTYVACADLDPTRIGRDAGRVNEEIIQHLATLPGATVTATLEIHVTVPGGIDERTLRVVSENATALKLRVSNFDRD